MSLKITVHENNKDESFIYEMANKWQEETNLPMNIWIDETQSYLKGKHSKRLKFQLDTSEKMKSDELGEMDMDGNIHPENLKMTKLSGKDITKLRNFVHNNRYALEYIADMDVHLHQIWNDMIMGGDLATDEQIKRLNAKVDKVLADNAKRKKK